MFWHKVPFGKKNFGDVLGPYIVEHLSGKEAMYTPLIHAGLNKKSILIYLKAIYNRKLSIREMFFNIKYFANPKDNLLITIGSVIDMYTNPNCNIWGSGIMHRHKHLSNANFYAVRGKYSQLRLKELGYDVPQTIGDPALLMPLLYKARSEKKYALGIIPHFLHYEETVKKIESDAILIINLLDPIERVIEDVCSCEKIISSSLHGIIIGHAYGVPSLWFRLSKGWIGGDDIKFADYFSSVALNEYEGFKIKQDSFDEKYLSNVQLVFTENPQITLVDSKVLRNIQVDLIKIAPFSILPKYKNIQ